ncbi:MAG TPA: hypothetical protein VD963_07765 [Phycisphaerales bacterium]|nr:hypothetical protein [Phycisphaerales bacterium]
MPLRAPAALSARLTALVGLVLPAAARAEFFQNTFGLNNPATVITFDSPTFPRFTFITNQYAGQGVSFTPHIIYDPQLAELPNITGHRLGSFNADGAINPYSIHFTEPQTHFAMALATNTGTTSFTALLNGVVVESATAPSSTLISNNFYGFANVLFDQIEVFTMPSGGFNGSLIDNFQLGVVPGPGAAGLLAALGLAHGRRRRPARAG